LIASAVDLAGEHAIDMMAAFEGLDATEVTTGFIGMWRSVLVQSDFTA